MTLISLLDKHAPEIVKAQNVFLTSQTAWYSSEVCDAKKETLCREIVLQEWTGSSQANLQKSEEQVYTGSQAGQASKTEHIQSQLDNRSSDPCKMYHAVVNKLLDLGKVDSPPVLPGVGNSTAENSLSHYFQDKISTRRDNLLMIAYYAVFTPSSPLPPSPSLKSIWCLTGASGSQ